jgi:hypothetical protein
MSKEAAKTVANTTLIGMAVAATTRTAFRDGRLIRSLSDASCTYNRFRRFYFCLLEENDKALA